MDHFHQLYSYSQEGLRYLAEQCLASKDGTFEGINVPLLLPYMHVEGRNKILIDYYWAGKDISELAGFITVEGYRKLVTLIIKTGMWVKGLDKHIHFLPIHEVDRLLPLGRFNGHIGPVEIQKFFPMASKDAVDEFFDEALVEGKLPCKDYMAFISEYQKHLLTLYWINDVLDFKIDDYYSFLTEEDRKLVKMHQQAKEEKAKKEQERKNARKR